MKKNGGDWLTVRGGPRDGARFLPLFDAVPGQTVRLVPLPAVMPGNMFHTSPESKGYYRISADGHHCDWVLHRRAA